MDKKIKFFFAHVTKKQYLCRLKRAKLKQTTNEKKNLLRAKTEYILGYVDQMRFTGNWTPDADTDVKLYHSLNDDLVAPENSLQMYQWLQNNGVQQAVLDTTSLTGTHLNSATYFILHVMTDDLSNW